MGRELPYFRAGQLWSDQSAAQMNALTDEVRRLSGLISQRGLSIPSGAKLSTPESSELIVPYPKTVVIVMKPLAADAMLTVREAKYRDLPPLPCETSGTNPPVKTCHYTWAGPPFAVWPPMGKEPIDYVGDEYVQGTDDIAPVFDTIFHRCHREGDVWVLDDPGAEGGGGIIPARVLTAVTGYTTIGVQPLKRDPNPPHLAWLNDGDPVPAVALWGNQKGEHFAMLINEIIPLVVVKGEPYAMQYFTFYTKTPTGLKGDCGL